MDKSGYTDMTSIQILVFFALVIIIAVYEIGRASCRERV